MKYLLFIFTLFSFNIYAQDILKLHTGDSLQVKVLEVTPTEIKYKLFDNLNGRAFTISKSSARSLTYQNGTKEQLTISPIPVFANENGFSIGDVVTTEYYGANYKGIVTQIKQDRQVAVVEINKNGEMKSINRPFFELTLIEKSSMSVANGLDNSPNSAEQFIQGQQDAKRYYKGYKGAGTGMFFAALLTGPVIGLIPAAICVSTPPSQRLLGMPDQSLNRNVSYITGYTQEAQRVKNRKVWGNYGIGGGIAIALALAFAFPSR